MNRERGRSYDLLGLALLRNAPGAHHQHPVGEDHGLRLVVGDKQRRDTNARLHVLQLQAHLLAQPGIEIGERLVEQQHVGVGDQRPPEGHPLLLAAGEERRRPVVEAFQAQTPQHSHDPLADLSRGHTLGAQGKGDVLEDGHVRPDSVALEYHAHAALLGRKKHAAGGRGQKPPAHVHVARVGALEPGHEAQGSRLAAAARPQQGHERSGRDVEADVVDRADLAERLGQAHHPNVLHGVLRASRDRLRIGAGLRVRYPASGGVPRPYGPRPAPVKAPHHLKTPGPAACTSWRSCRPLQREQGSLGFDATDVLADRPVAPHDAVAGHDDGQGLLAHALPAARTALGWPAAFAIAA